MEPELWRRLQQSDKVHCSFRPKFSSQLSLKVSCPTAPALRNKVTEERGCWTLIVGRPLKAIYFCLLNSLRFEPELLLTSTLWIRKIEHRKWNRGRNRLPKLVQTIAPSIPFPVFHPLYPQGTVKIIGYCDKMLRVTVLTYNNRFTTNVKCSDIVANRLS